MYKSHRTRKSRFTDRSGQRYGNLTVVSPDLSVVPMRWVCSCACGRQVSLRLNGLLNPKRKGCGSCGRKLLPEGEAAFNALYSEYQRQSSKRGLDFELSREEFRNIVLKDCHYCGEAPSNTWRNNPNTHPGNGSFVYSGIDRVDNSKGYVIRNVVPCCIVCNRAKHTLTEEQFLEWVRRAYRKLEDSGV